MLGCPSALINPCPNLGRQLSDKLHDLSNEGGEARIGVTAAAPFEIAGDASRVALERKLFSMMAAFSGLYIQQSGGLTAMLVAKGALAKANENELTSIYKSLGGDMSPPQFWNTMGRTSRFYFSAIEWIREMQGLCAVFGSRLHGSMAAIAAGTPGVIIVHDSRTAELASLMRLPTLTQEEAMTALSVAELAQRVEFGGAAFYEWRNRTGCRLRELLRAAGVECSVPLAHAVDKIANDKITPGLEAGDCGFKRNSGQIPALAE